MDKVAVLGFGSSGRRLFSIVRERLPQAEFLVFSSQDLSGQGFPTTTELSDVTRFEPTIAIVCGVASQRLHMVKALPDEVRGVLVEKPLAMNFDEASQVTKELKDRGAVTQVGFNLRFSPSLREFRRRVLGLRLGRVISVRAETGQYLPGWRVGRDYRTTASATEKLGGGVLRELSHEIDYLSWIFGDVEWVSAWTGQQSELEIDVEDSAHLTLGFRSETSLVGQLNIDFVRHDATRLITAVCAEGTIQWDGIAGRVKEWHQGGHQWEVSFLEQQNAPTTYQAQWDSFYAALESGAIPDVTADDGLAAMSVIDGARASHESGGLRIAPERGGQDQ